MSEEKYVIIGGIKFKKNIYEYLLNRFKEGFSHTSLTIEQAFKELDNLDLIIDKSKDKNAASYYQSLSDYQRKDIYDINRRESFHSCLRSIDWKRGNPYIYRLEDFESLIHSEFLFARKFDQNVDKNIVDKLKEYLEKENGKKV